MLPLLPFQKILCCLSGDLEYKVDPTGPVLFSCMHYPFTEHMHILIQWEA
jgi:hypothetical protein